MTLNLLYPIQILNIDPALEEEQVNRLKRLREGRDNVAVEKSLKELKEAALSSSENIMPPPFEAVKCYATIGEIVKTLKEVFGVYKE